MADRRPGALFIQLPQDPTDANQLRRFLDRLLQQLDIAFGNRGNAKLTTALEFTQSVEGIKDEFSELWVETETLAKLDGSRQFTGAVGYDGPKILTDHNFADVLYVQDYAEPKFTKNTAFNKDFGTVPGTVTEGGTTTNNPQQPAITSLALTVSNPPTQAEVQAIADKVDEILVALRNANLIQV